jgi:hypothetical protein
LVTSRERDDLVASLVATRTRTPGVLPARAEIAATRQAELAGSVAARARSCDVRWRVSRGRRDRVVASDSDVT